MTINIHLLSEVGQLVPPQRLITKADAIILLAGILAKGRVEGDCESISPFPDDAGVA